MKSLGLVAHPSAYKSDLPRACVVTFSPPSLSMVPNE